MQIVPSIILNADLCILNCTGRKECVELMVLVNFSGYLVDRG